MYISTNQLHIIKENCNYFYYYINYNKTLVLEIEKNKNKKKNFYINYKQLFISKKN